jgi:methyl-CpG-binding domain protein 2
VPPIRQTASIFKQPVTVIKTQEGKVKSDLKHGNQEKPKQLFWEKRLEVCLINIYLQFLTNSSKSS